MGSRRRSKQEVPRIVALLASGIDEEALSSLGAAADHIVKAIRNVALQLRYYKRGLLYCPLCMRGPFTKNGYYLHLIRVHEDDMVDMVRVEAERVSGSSRIYGP